MEEVFLVPAESKDKAELLLRSDDIISRQSIIVRSAPHLDVDESGYFIIIIGSGEAIDRAKELLKGIASVYDQKEKVIAKHRELEDRANEGFGNILGF